MKKAILFSGWALQGEEFKKIKKQFQQTMLINWNFFNKKPFPKIEKIKELIEKQAPDYTLIAFSMGGLFAIELASLYPIKQLILFSPFACFNQNNQPIITKSINLMINKIKEKKARQVINQFYEKISAPFYLKENQFINTKNLILGLEILKKTNLITSLKKIKCKTKIFYGEKDQIINIENIHTLKNHIAKAKIKILKKNHYIF